MSTRMLLVLPLVVPGFLGLAGCFKDSQDDTTVTSASDATDGGSTAMTSMTSTASMTGTTSASSPTTGATDSDEPTGGTGTGGGTDTGATTGGALCPGERQTLQPSRPSVMLVIDRSGSMALTWDHDGVVETPEVARWSSVHAAVSATLKAFDTTVNFGLSTSPSSTATSAYSADACVVDMPAEVAPGPVKAGKILKTLPPGDVGQLEGADPIAAALMAALVALEKTDPALPRHIFLVSNGLPQCHAGAMDSALFEVYDPDAVAVAGAAIAAGIPVHVIGVGLKDVITPVAMDGIADGISYFKTYEEIAMAGGTAPFIDATVETTMTVALTAPLETSVAKVNPCLVALDIVTSNPSQALVVLDGQELEPVEDCAAASGYRFVGPLPHGSLEVCGAACTQFQAVGEVDVLYCDPSD